MVAVTSVSAFMLTSSTTSAAPEEKSARIEVRNACSMESEVSNAHTATVSAGSYKDNIGTTVVSVVCNDNAGFAVYAIGFTNDTDGTTTMNGLQGGTIATGLAKQGNTSSWSMKLSTYDNDAYAPTIENDYDDYNVVPDDYIMVASYPAATTVSEPSVFKTSYAAYASMSQAADTYTGQVKYVMVHPSTGDAPEKEEPVVSPLDPDPDPTKDTVHPCMKIGDLACTDTDDDGEPDSLVFPANSLLRTYEIAYTNAGKPMYIEDANTTIGWRPMVESDYATVGGKEVRFAMQDIAMNLGDTANNKVCSAAANSLPDNSYIDQAFVMDIRDGKSYWITKYADNKCWMSQNLDLDLSTTKKLTHADTDLGWTTLNTNAELAPERDTITFDGSTTTTVSGWTDSYADPYSADPGTQYVVSSGTTSNDAVFYTLETCMNNNTPDITTDDRTAGECSHYHTGNYYNWTAAIASNDSTAISTQYDVAPDSICPAGWRLSQSLTAETKTEEVASEWNKLLVAQGITSKWGKTDEKTGYTTDGFKNIRHTPLFLVRAGYVYSGSLDGRAGYGYYWSSSVYSSYFAYSLGFNSSNVYPSYYYTRDRGFAARCVAR